MSSVVMTTSESKRTANNEIHLGLRARVLLPTGGTRNINTFFTSNETTNL